jgi:hypothetical protein
MPNRIPEESNTRRYQLPAPQLSVKRTAGQMAVLHQLGRDRAAPVCAKRQSESSRPHLSKDGPRYTENLLDA